MNTLFDPFILTTSYLFLRAGKEIQNALKTGGKSTAKEFYS